MVDQAYWASAAVNTKVFEIAKMLAYMSMGFFGYEFLRTIAFDYSILSGKSRRKWPHLAYFGAKYLLITYYIQNLICLWTKDEINCQIFMELLEMQMGFVVVCSSFLLACRTVCVYQGSARTCVTIILSIFGLGLLATWMVGVQDLTMVWSVEAATAYTKGACAWTAIRSTYWVKYVVTIVFDLLVLILTTVGIMRMNSSSRIGEILIKHGLIYFVFTFFINMVVTILTALQLSPTMSTLAAIPQSTVCVICSTRLYIMLVEEARPRNRDSYCNSATTSHPSSFLGQRGRRILSFLGPDGRKADGVIPFSTASQGKTDTQKSQDTGSYDYVNTLEKVSTTSGSIIHVEQSLTVEIDPLPPHLVDMIPFGRRGQAISISSVEELLEDNATADDVRSNYPNLFAARDNAA
ncbi:hypothetical protein CBS101457_002155 [Exobasidium rhododendri]|nr:hypothetical protein CBS101457_002155 [Exobasidium rhododendri]